ncbi:MAG: PAS domain-containing protein, partial [Thermodesulfobacteriota bacterium]|nr:PAS domain-containing protein [Thermodesulfobacteriota bacterium]
MGTKPTLEKLEQRIRELEQLLVEQRHAEERLRTLSLAIELSNEGIAVTDSGGNLEYSNQAFARMHGRSVEELIGENISILHTPQQIMSVEESIRQLKETGHFKGEVWHVKSDGTVFPVSIYNSLILDEDGNEVGILTMLRDITDVRESTVALRESEERFHKLS